MKGNKVQRAVGVNLQRGESLGGIDDQALQGIKSTQSMSLSVQYDIQTLPEWWLGKDLVILSDGSSIALVAEMGKVCELLKRTFWSLGAISRGYLMPGRHVQLNPTIIYLTVPGFRTRGPINFKKGLWAYAITTPRGGTPEGYVSDERRTNNHSSR